MKNKRNKKSFQFFKTTKKKSSDRVPQGRTLSTRDNYLGRNSKSTKERPVVVIESNKRNELAVVPLSSREGRNRTRLWKYQQGQSYFKHYVEIEDDEGKPIKVNKKFRENHKNMDLSKEDVGVIRHTVFKHSVPMISNQNKIKKFRGKKNPRD